ncbi:LysR family transcriptional regulator [Clostridium sp. chh4-2]|uniref:LysR family transcriptional regulator n=1 Tax=Clostridium sp. chh4-2 TaxID=2067550 RepID=UPI000CCED50B|nr:LysR family transcriptional regulator [Clostridium sp. chh4-2]PNV62410.1 LysR family transcriptional regulator [Clostridium sp. chh4-2]
MTLAETGAFLAIVKYGSISLAAEKLYVTQPALSRHLSALEKELGYCLIKRSKGIRTVELTGEGRAFIAVAEQFQRLWKEAKNLPDLNRNHTFHLSSVGSVSTYLLPEIFPDFMNENPGVSLMFHNYHSLEAYDYVEKGEVDLAIISDDMFSRHVETIPLFREPMVCLKKCPVFAGLDVPVISPAELDPHKEVRLPWNPEYDIWHDYWFQPAAQPNVFLDQMSLLEGFLQREDVWAVAPASVGHAIGRRLGLNVFELKDGPPPRIIYYLLGKERKPLLTEAFLKCLKEKINELDYIQIL